jgi:flagellar hook-associated protein 1 FlgK
MLNSLNVAQSGLAVAQTQVENVMNNITNENTIGYKKRVVDVKEMDHSDSRLTGRGAQVQDVNRITNMYVYDNLVKEQSKDVQHQELSSMLADIEAIFFETDDSGLSSDLNKYFQSIEDLRASPYNEIYKSNVANSGQILVDDLKSLYEDIQAKERVVNNTLNDSVDEINGLLRDIGIVNQKIIDSDNSTPNALMDERDLLESKISQYVQVDIDRTDDYVMSIGGTTAIRYNTNIHDLSVVEDNIAQKDIYANLNNESTLIDKTTWEDSGTPDTLTYYFNKETSLTVTAGEDITDSSGNVILTVDKDNIVQAMTYKINNDPALNSKIHAFNGQYHLDENGNKIPLDPTNEDHFLIIESTKAGIDGKFEGRFIVNDDDTKDSNGNQISNLSLKNEIKSVKANNDIHFEIFDSELNIKTGKVKSLIDNIDTTSPDNKFTKYKNMLDDFAKALSDFTDSYIELDDGVYISGEEKSLLHHEKANIKNISLFDGSSVETLKFNKSATVNLTQEDLDYLSTMQWNENVNIDSNSTSTTSFTRFYERLRVEISSDKENVDYLKQTQSAVTQSLQLNYDKLVKVNKDDEMINLMKFQSAYEANAKLITIVDEMLATILGMKR